MQVLDLTHTITDAMSCWPGTPQVSLTPLAKLEEDGFRETLVSMASHIGTHLDAPAHLLPNGTTLDSMPPAQFVGSAVVLDCSNRGAISLAMLQSYTQLLSRAEFVLLYTGWSRHWKTPDYFDNYPVLNPDAASYLASLRLKGLGVDTISVDAFMDADCPIHRILLGSGMMLLENLRNLRGLCGREFFLTAAPLKLRNADGAPARVFALI